MTRRKKEKMAKFQTAHVLKAYKMPTRQIALTVGVSYPTVAMWLRYPNYDEYVNSLKERKGKFTKKVEPAKFEKSVELVSVTNQLLLKIATNLEKLVLLEERKQTYKKGVQEF